MSLCIQDSFGCVENICFNNITFADGKGTTREELSNEINMEINPVYPNTTPRGGTGYGVLGKVYIE